MTYQRPLQWVAVATAVIVSLWFNPATLDPFNITKLAVLVIGAAALLGLLVGYAKSWWSRQEALLVGAVTLFLLGLSAAAVASEQDIYRVLWGAWARNNGWMAYAALAVVFLAFAIAFRGRSARHGLYTLAAVGVVQVLYGTLQTTGNDFIAWNSGYNPIIGTVGNPNFASALLGMSAVAMLWLVLDDQHGIALRIGSGLFALWAVFLTIRSESIQGTLAFAAGFAVLLAGWLSDAARPAALRRLVLPYLGLGALGGALGVLGLGGVGPLASILDSQNFANRKYYWKTAWHMFQDHPLFGVGLDSMGDYYRQYRAYDTVGMPGFGVTTNNAHSILFQLLATGGLALAATYLLLQVLVAWRAFVAFRSGEHRALVAGLLGVWVAFVLQSLFSIDQLGLTIWGWTIGGLIVGVSFAAPSAPVAKKVRGRVQQQSLPSGSTSAFVAASVLALGAVLLVAWPLGKDAGIRTAISYAPDKTQPAAVQAVAKLILDEAEGATDPYWRAQLVGKLYEINAIEDGISLAKESVQMYPRDTLLWNLIAIAYEQTGRPADALEARQRTVELDPMNTDYQALLEQDKAA